MEFSISKVTTPVINFIKEVDKNSFFRALTYGIVFSLFMTLVIGYLSDVFDVNQSKFPYIVIKTPGTSYWVAILFASFSFLFAFFGYVSDINSREDILTPLRKKLVGNWQVRAQTWNIEATGIVLGYSVSYCTITIEDIGRKLSMRFEVRDSDIFIDQTIDITHITLSYRSEPRQLIYFHEFDLLLKQTVGEGPAATSKYHFPFLGILTLPLASDEIKEMSGRWYDIDNTIFNLAAHIPNLKGFDEISKSVNEGRITFKGDLRFTKLPAISHTN